MQPWKNRDGPVGWERQRVLGYRPGKENSEQGIVWQHSCVPSWGRQGSKHFTATRRHLPTNPQSAVPPELHDGIQGRSSVGALTVSAFLNSGCWAPQVVPQVDPPTLMPPQISWAWGSPGLQNVGSRPQRPPGLFRACLVPRGGAKAQLSVPGRLQGVPGGPPCRVDLMPSVGLA